jgi:hypothetical protein
MPLTQVQEDLEHELRVELMTIQTEHYKSVVKWEPWKAMAVAAGAGAAVMGASIGIMTLLVRWLHG